MLYYPFDIETTGFKPRQGAEIFAFCYGPLEKVEVYREDSYPLFWGELHRVFLNNRIGKVCHHYKFELEFLQAHKVPIPDDTVWHDTLIMDQLLRNNATSHALDKVAEYLCGDPAQIREWREVDQQVSKLARHFGGRFDRVPKGLMDKYQYNDGVRTGLIFEVEYPEIKSNPKLHQDYLNEIELVKTTLRLEAHGIRINPHTIRRLVKRMQDDLDRVQARCFELFGEFINLNSGDQVARVLYKILRLPVYEYTPKGKPSTDKDILLALREKHPHEVLELILQQRSYTKGIAIVNGYLEHAGRTGIIHPTINTNHARTGRESSEAPNLQNVSKEEVLKNPYAVAARQCFITYWQHVLLFVDYAGIEMRLIIEAAQEKELLELVKANGDPHALAASLLYGQRWEQADATMKKVLRSAAKNASFAIAYGAGVQKVALTLNLPFAEAEAGFKRYRERLPHVAYFTKNIVRTVKECGYVVTPFGRTLYVDIDKPYVGANYLIQGMAAGILKRAQVRVDKYLRTVWGDKIRLVLPIHDELVISYPRELLDKKEKILAAISSIMTTMPEIKVPLAVEWKISFTNWNAAKELKI